MECKFWQNLLVTCVVFPWKFFLMLVKSQRQSHYLRCFKKRINQITNQYFYCLCYLKSLKELFFIKKKSFLSLNKILYDSQSGFMKKQSTDTCFSILNYKILKGLDDGLLTAMILIDLQKSI